MAAFRVNLALLLAVPQASASLAPFSSTRIAVISPDAGSASPLEEALLQADAAKEKESKLRGPYSAGWFGGFSEGESTYDHDGELAHRDANPQINVMDGWNPKQKNPFFDRGVDRDWFQESRSGGAKQAWQSFYPAEQASMSGNRAQTGRWFEGDGGVFEQDYVGTSALKSQSVPAGWFDDSVNQLDGFGRQKLPGLGSPRNYIDWQERSVNTTLSCKAPGCTANVSLLAPFNFNTEMYKNCRLSVFFHPTDFDDQYSGESVEWLQVGGSKVKTTCRPQKDGCNQTASRPLIPCVEEVPIDLLMPKNGDLKIGAKIHDYVDECPYKGNMLSAVPTVTCLVAPLHNKGVVASPVTLVTNNNMTCVTKMPLRCASKGCASQIAIPVNSTCAGLGQCLLSIKVQQTDYDNADGTAELIEYIKVNGQHAVSKLKPANGKNPCKSKWTGKNLTAQEMSFMALSKHALNITNGTVMVEGKISKFVDECASNGYLFDAEATVTCSKPGGKTALLQKDVSAPRRKLRGHSL